MCSEERTKDGMSPNESRSLAQECDHPSQLASDGNRQALDDLFVSNGPGLYQAAFRILSNPHDAEDAVQDGMLCAFRNLTQFQGRAKLSTWLYRIIVNASLMRLRKRKSRPEFPLDPVFSTDEMVAQRIHPASADPDPEAQCVHAEEQKMLSWALLKLPRLYRSAFELCQMQGLPAREAALRMGVPVTTVKARLFRARRLLKATILRGRSVPRFFSTAVDGAGWRVATGD